MEVYKNPFQHLAERIASNLNQQTGKIQRAFELIKAIEVGRKSVMIAGEQYDIADTIEYYVKSILILLLMNYHNY